MRPGHVGLNVTDLTRSVAFYTRVFRLDVLGEGDKPGRHAFLGHGSELVLTLWEQSEGRFPDDRPGLHHLAFQVGSLDEVLAAEREVRELGASFLYDGPVAHGEGAASGGIFFSDPDGVRLEIYAPTATGLLTVPVPDAPSCGFF